MFFRLITVFVALTTFILAPASAEARAGMGGSMGSRGMRTYMAPPPTRTVPSAQPIERSVTPTTPSSASPAVSTPYPTPQPQSGFAQRNPFMTGLVGGLVGAGIGGLLFGHGFGMGGLGFAGGIGLMLQFALMAGLAWFAYSFFRGRREEPVGYPGFSLPHSDLAIPSGRSHIPAVPRDVEIQELRTVSGPNENMNLHDADFDEFERLLGVVQQSWSKGDIAALRRIVTPEMLSYFSEQLAVNTSKGLINTVEDVKLEQADLSEAWREGDLEYATVSLHFSAHDYMCAMDDGRLVDGSKTEHVEATETWTFMRQLRGRWLLSAIQQ